MVAVKEEARVRYPSRYVKKHLRLRENTVYGREVDSECDTSLVDISERNHFISFRDSTWTVDRVNSNPCPVPRFD